MMAHSWESPANAAREVLLDDILVEQLPDRTRRLAIVDLVFEELERQLGDADDEMIVSGQEVLDASGNAAVASLFYRRRVIEEIWRTMVAKAFGR